MSNHFGDRSIAKQAHSDDQPNNLLGGKTAPPECAVARRCQGFVDPHRIEMLAEPVERTFCGYRRCEDLRGKTHGRMLILPRN